MGNLFNNYEVKESIDNIDEEIQSVLNSTNDSYESFKEGVIKASSIYAKKYKELAEETKEHLKALTDIVEKKNKIVDGLKEYCTERRKIVKDIKSKFNELKRICEKLPEEDRVKFERIGLDIDSLLEDYFK